MGEGMILSLCDKTGNMVRPWAEAGHRCVCVDTQHSIRRDRIAGNVEYVWGDVRGWWPDALDDVSMVFAFPPCTHLAKSGARDWAKKGLTRLIDALQVVEACRRICVAAEERGAVWMLENPNGRLSTLWRKPDHFFDPYEYAGYLADPLSEAYTKRTDLWVGGPFVMPEKRAVVPIHGSRMHTAFAPGPERADLRAVTPEGFARAVFEANRSTIRKAA